MKIENLEIDRFITEKYIPVIDVRSPAEYQRGHIPGSINIPLFDDEGRAKVGTVYKTAGKEKAMLTGLELAGPRLPEILSAALQIDQKYQTGRKLRIYCWRGGKRSNSVGWLLANSGFSIKILKGGYKAFRNFVLQQFTKKYKLKILGGYTGSGKTQILHKMRNAGKQVIDLEALACHRGSAFGAMTGVPQPTQAMFENLLATDLLEIKPENEVWLEDESRLIGKLSIPHELWLQMRSVPVTFVDVSRPDRAAYLANEYKNLTNEQIIDSLNRIQKRIGGENFKTALSALNQNDREKVAHIVLEYYDRAYDFGLQKRDNLKIQKFSQLEFSVYKS